jgi:hypothetical protein
MTMSDTVPAFVSELIRAANEIERLTPFESARLLHRAASTIRDYRDEINYSDTPANDRGTPDDIVYCVNEMAARIETFAAHEVAETMLEAAETIKAGRILLEAKQEYEAIALSGSQL